MRNDLCAARVCVGFQVGPRFDCGPRAEVNPGGENDPIRWCTTLTLIASEPNLEVGPTRKDKAERFFQSVLARRFPIEENVYLIRVASDPEVEDGHRRGELCRQRDYLTRRPDSTGGPDGRPFVSTIHSGWLVSASITIALALLLCAPTQNEVEPVKEPTELDRLVKTRSIDKLRAKFLQAPNDDVRDDIRAAIMTVVGEVHAEASKIHQKETKQIKLEWPDHEHRGYVNLNAARKQSFKTSYGKTLGRQFGT